MDAKTAIQNIRAEVPGTDPGWQRRTIVQLTDIVEAMLDDIALLKANKTNVTEPAGSAKKEA